MSWSSPKLRRMAFSGLGTLLVLGTLVVLNGISHYAFKRLDFSAGHVYSISSGTKRILSTLTDNLIVKVYFTPHLPQPYGLNEQYLRDLLGEYKADSKGHVIVEFLDPDSDKIKQEALGAGISAVQVNVMARDKFEVKEAFMGLALLYKGRSQVLPFIQSTADLEYDLTSRIKKLADPTLKTVGFVAGHGEKSPDDPSQAALFAPMRDEMDIKTVSLDKPIPPDLDALWILGPTQRFKSSELDALRTWLYEGKPLGIFLNRRSVNFQAFYAMPLETGLEDLLKDWGLRLGDGFVVDAQSENVQFQQQIGQFVAMRIQQYPYIPVATHFDPSNPAVNHLEGATLPFVHPIFHSTSSAAGLSYDSLISSTKNSWLNDSYNVSIAGAFDGIASKRRGPFSLAAVLTGAFPKPAVMNADLPHKPSRAVVVGTAYLLDPHFADRQSSRALLMNLIEWSYEDQDLLAIRGKGVSYRPLRPLPDAKRMLVKYAMILFLPLALLVFGAFKYRRQAARRRRAVQIYGEASATDAAAQTAPVPISSS